eukprot:6488469-Alexandrium_andersonii.AAC.1
MPGNRKLAGSNPQSSNPQSAQSLAIDRREPTLIHRFRRSNLELRGPSNDLKVGLRSPRGVESAPFSFVQIPNMLTKPAGGRAGGDSWG